jgi:hypothetical protein
MNVYDQLKLSNIMSSRYFFLAGLFLFGVGLLYSFSLPQINPSQGCIFNSRKINPPEIGALKTNTEIGIIDLMADTQTGNFEKNMVPSIEKVFLITDEADMLNCLSDVSEFILVEFEDIKRAYPMGVLERHQIINDVINNQNIAITYSPYSNSMNVFKTDDYFYSSGRLFHGNSLILDSKTESLWLQLTGDAVMGDKTGDKLEPIQYSIVNKEYVLDNSNIEIMSLDSGYRFDYTQDLFTHYQNQSTIYPNISINPEQKLNVQFDIYNKKVIENENPPYTTEVYLYTAEKIIELFESKSTE